MKKGMITLLAKLFIKNKDETNAPQVRKAYGVLCGALGIFLNVLLFCGKILAGTMTASIAITADAFNNLSDAGSSVITLIGFQLAGQKPDPEHPFGHGRMEYVTGLIVSLIIILMGVELGKSSVEKIFSPEPVTTNVLSFLILAASILVKGYMAFYNGRVAKKLDSPAIRAARTDSLMDAFATAVVLLCMGISHFLHVNVDGYAGLLVALFILYGGVNAARDTISPLLGQPPDGTFVKQVYDIVMAHREVVGVHDLVVHDYGPGRVMVSLHAEVPAEGDIVEMHDAVDNIEKELAEKLCCDVVIHMDPIVDNALCAAIKTKVETLVKQIDDRVTLHDFRMVVGPTHTNLIFDLVVPFDLTASDAQIKTQVETAIESMEGNFYAVIQVDKSYVL